MLSEIVRMLDALIKTLQIVAPERPDYLKNP